MRLLLVDDHPAGLAARTSVLGELGFTITTASSAERALALFHENPFPMVVTDYRLPGMNGVELIAAIRAVAPETKIILISGFVDALGLTEEKTAADAVLSKSSNEVAQMIRAVQRLTKRTASKKPGRAGRSTRRAATGG